MKQLLTAGLLSFLLFYAATTNAQEQLAAKKFDNPQWKRVILFSFKPNSMDRGKEVIKNYFTKAATQAGTPQPSMLLDLVSGEWDMMIVFDMKGGIEEMNWEISPTDVKWMNALSTIAGSPQKAKAINEEFNSLIARSTSYIAKSAF